MSYEMGDREEMEQREQEAHNCLIGKIHAFQDVKRIPLLEQDTRGNYLVIQRCKHCKKRREYFCV